MNPIFKKQAGSALLAGLGWLAMGLGASAQVSVDTVGGGVRVECGSSSGFVGGNTYDRAQFNAPWSCALDTNGNLWIADKNNNDIEQVSHAGDKGASVTTEYYTVSGTAPHLVTNYHAFTNVTSVAVDPANNLYVFLPSPPEVLKASLATESTSLNLLSALLLTNVPAGAGASAMVVDGSSNVFLAFTNGVIIRFQMLDSNPPPTVYIKNYALGGSPAVHYIVTNGFKWKPAGMALRPDGRLAVSDTLSNAIYVVSTNDYTANPGPRLITGAHGAGFDDGSSFFAQFNGPAGLAASADGRLIVCDKLNNRLRVIDASSNTTTLYGTDSSVWPATCCTCNPTLYAGWVDGAPGNSSTNAAGRQPVSVAISPSGSLFVTEVFYSLIREVNNGNFLPVNLGASNAVAETEAASSVTPTSATLNGIVNPGGDSAYYYFQWGLTTSYGNTSATNLIGTNLTTPANVSAVASNLLPAANYNFQLVAFNSLGVSYGSNLTFVTPAEAAAVVTLPAMNAGNSATLNASVNPENSMTTVNFQWGIASNNLGLATTPISLTNNLTSTQPVASAISNLQPGMIYYYQAVAQNAGGSSVGGVLTLVTPAVLPVAVTEFASGVTATNATLNGMVNPGAETAFYYFEWGLTTNYGNITATSLLTNSGSGPQPVSAAIGNLTAATIYHYQLVAYNSVGSSYGGDLTALTASVPGQVATLPATGITTSGATLNATVNPENSLTSVIFQWGLSASNLANTTTPISLTNNLTNTQVVSYMLGNLQANTTYYYEVVAYNTGGTTSGNPLLFTTLPPPTLSISPGSGYFPNCTNITVNSSVPTVYYTTDGSAPTTNSAEVLMTSNLAGAYNGSIAWCNPQQDLSVLRVIAVSGASVTMVQGGFPTANLIGFPQSLSAGPGGHLYIPVVVDLQSNVTLESLQFRVEITPDDTNAPMLGAMALQPLTSNDFVILPGPAPGNTPVAFETYPYTTSSNGQGLVITAPGNGSGLNMQGPGVVVMLHVTIPNTAVAGQSYSLNALDPSGTSDGARHGVSMTTLPIQTLTISDPPYMVGDSSPSTGYNAGQFGDGALDNSDVNNAIYASVGIRVPPSDSDIYNSMDVWPPDSAGRGGDGFIRLLDWETILGRSVGGVPIYPGLDTNNYIRFWTNGDNGFPSHQVVDWSPDGPPVALARSMLAMPGTPPGMVWLSQASIGSGTITSALPGNTYSLPVWVKVLPGYSLAGLQFRTIVTGGSGAPAVSSIQFNPAGGVPAPLVLDGLAGNDKVQAWSFGSFAAPLRNSNYLGTVSFQVPPGAGQGACYALHFSGVDGAPDFTTAYQLESHPGSVWVMSSALQPSSITSDEWKTAFFGSATNGLAGDDVDADGDGSPNWQEYLAGTNPTNAFSCLQFSSAGFYNNGARGVAINWLTAPGKTYILQSSSALKGANWTPINTNSGDGNEYQCIDTNMSGNARFYQIRLQP